MIGPTPKAHGPNQSPAKNRHTQLQSEPIDHTHFFTHFRLRRGRIAANFFSKKSPRPDCHQKKKCSTDCDDHHTQPPPLPHTSNPPLSPPHPLLSFYFRIPIPHLLLRFQLFPSRFNRHIPHQPDFPLFDQLKGG